MNQHEYMEKGSIKNVEDILKSIKPKKIFLVTGKTSYYKSGANRILEPLLENYSVTHFMNFSPNPKLKDIKKGIRIFKEGFDLIIAVGGGSSIDTAKSINILSAQRGNPAEYVKKKVKIDRRGCPLIAIPTTAGSGSEATHFAVVYITGIKYSLAHEFILPEYAIVDPLLTLSMPKSLTASTGMDAFSQAMESCWSITSTKESRLYAEKAIKLILSNIKESVNTRSVESRNAMSEAAHLAGKAINISKTTASHALSYILTSRFGIPHGHAVALTLGQVLQYNAGVTENDCNDRRGKEHVKKIINKVLSILNCSTPREAKIMIQIMMKEIGLETDIKKLGITYDDIESIINNVNYERLRNNPRKFKDIESLRSLFQCV